MNYNFINKINGWVVFAIATIVYLLTIEDTASLWDCGEYITAAYKLEVGHPPGAPLYMILGRVFSFFAAPENVAFYINALSALSSSFTILFPRKRRYSRGPCVSYDLTWASRPTSYTNNPFDFVSERLFPHPSVHGVPE